MKKLLALSLAAGIVASEASAEHLEPKIAAQRAHITELLEDMEINDHACKAGFNPPNVLTRSDHKEEIQLALNYNRIRLLTLLADQKAGTVTNEDFADELVELLRKEHMHKEVAAAAVRGTIPSEYKKFRGMQAREHSMQDSCYGKIDPKLQWLVRKLMIKLMEEKSS